jgi:zinc/manganese transport system substrate-binding protein
MIKKLAVLLVAALSLTGCAQAQPWTAGTGEIKIVASTNVWGSIAHEVAGEYATVTSLIYNTNQDPHSFEASARDQLEIEEADIVIMNGGGYDDFVETLVEADETPAILVNAFQAAGDDANRNEHIWYDVDQVGDVAAVIAGAIEAIDPTLFDEVFANSDAFRAKLELRKAKLDRLKTAGACGKVFATEPLIDYILEDAGCINVTPLAYSNAIEEERDVPPAAYKEASQVLEAGVQFIASNQAVRSSQVDRLIATAKTTPTFGFSELLPQDPDTYEYEGSYLDMIDSALVALSFKK